MDVKRLDLTIIHVPFIVYFLIMLPHAIAMFGLLLPYFIPMILAIEGNYSWATVWLVAFLLWPLTRIIEFSFNVRVNER